MSRSTIGSILGCALLAAASPSLALTLSVLPAHPADETPFTLAVGGIGSCPSLDTLQIQVRTVIVHLKDLCLSPTHPFLLEVPVPPLPQGSWSLQVFFDGQSKALAVTVEPPPLRLDFDPPDPQAGQPFLIRATQNVDCFELGNVMQDGRLLSLGYVVCVFPSFGRPPGPIIVEKSVGPLPAGDYVVNVIGAQKILPSRRFHISDPAECAPSETALCLLQGRYRVEATWRTATAEGVALAQPESDGFGAFSLADVDRLELFVELADACGDPAHAVGVSTSGLTDAEVEVTVTEVATGEVRRYQNPLGMRFALISDPQAFDCTTQAAAATESTYGDSIGITSASGSAANNRSTSARRRSRANRWLM
jgi:hypothetical protein